MRCSYAAQLVLNASGENLTIIMILGNDLLVGKAGGRAGGGRTRKVLPRVL